jgi:hypothetical protein
MAMVHEPWLNLPVDDQIGELRVVVISLVNHVRARQSQAAKEALPALPGQFTGGTGFFKVVTKGSHTQTSNS